jgi:dolichol-phosphate mannosyltransferase
MSGRVETVQRRSAYRQARASATAPDALPIAVSGAAVRSRAAAAPAELTIVVPTLNECGNLWPLMQRLERALAGIRWEVIFVDDDSRDGSADVLRDLQQRLPHVRAIRRIGRRGLSSACMEGMLASAAPYLAVMDADLQHDETILPEMMRRLQQSDLDIVIGSRFIAGGSAGTGLSQRRLWLSRLGSSLSRMISGASLSDPMSGFFMLRRGFLEQTVRNLSGHGFKILLDLFASSPRQVRFSEIPYTFRERHAGHSKLDSVVMLDYLTLISDKILGEYVPIRFAIFVLVGLFGVMVHLTMLALLFKGIELAFYPAQVLATLAAMTFNFNLNNLLTYRDRRLRGRGLIAGHLSFFLVCSIGAIANFQIAEMLYEMRVPWALAGLLGAVVGAVWNYGVSSTFTWRQR